VGTDDIGELVQDGIAIAAALLSSADARGKHISAGNVSYFAVKLVRQGWRSTGQSRTDVMHPLTQISGRCKVTSLDAPIAEETKSDETLCLHDILATDSADPSQEAAKRLDWEPLLAALDATTRPVLLCLVAGVELTTLVPKLKRSRSAIQSDTHRLAGMVSDHLGDDILRQVQELPRWVINITANRQRLACRVERQIA